MTRASTIVAVVSALSLMVSACGSSAKTTTPGASTPTQPSPQAAVASAISTYRDFVESEAAQLDNATSQFARLVQTGNVAGAKKAYAEVHSHYERIEPVAERLGMLDSQIDAQAGDVPAAQFEGFHRIEEQLWDKGNANAMSPVAGALLLHVSDLQSRIPQLVLDPKLLAAGAVELLNEVATRKITGEEERYSHTDLWDIEANLEGSRQAIAALRPIIEAKDPQLATTLDTRFAATETTLAKYGRGAGYVLYTALTPSDIRALGAQVHALADDVAKVVPLVRAS
jgi:iron uptake system component EfeO